VGSGEHPGRNEISLAPCEPRVDRRKELASSSDRIGLSASEASNLPCMNDRTASFVTIREQFERLGFIVGYVGERLISVEVTGRVLSDTACVASSCNHERSKTEHFEMLSQTYLG
jgi:hypothetical protein